MLSFFMSEAATLARAIQAAAAFALLMAFAPSVLRSQETRIVALHGLAEAEVRQQGFTLPRPMKVHVYARGAGGASHLGPRATQGPLFAYGWILNAATREVVWQMDAANSKRDWDYRVADHYLDLPAGAYEAYFANHAFGRRVLFGQWSRNIDRRSLAAVESQRPRGFLAAFGADDASLLHRWREQVGNYGMELYAPGAADGEVVSFEAPLRWARVALSLAAASDGGEWQQAFRLTRPIALHVYALGEGSERRMNDYGWITDLRTRKRVWEMTPGQSRFAGGARKNRRQVETIQLPAGDYLATFVTDDSHSPADWNGAPPCDPALYGLTLSLPEAADQGAFSLRPQPEAGPVLAELVKVGDDQDRSQAFTLARPQAVRVYALGEAGDDEMADTAWIEDSTGRRVWEMGVARSHHAGGASKNRVADEVVELPKGTFTLRVRTDGSHAYGRWNSARPRDPEHYGATVYAVK